jgi:hypothetical protein
MNRLICILLLLGLVGFRCAAFGATRTADRSDWAAVEIRLTANETLKDLFDAGLRPYRFPTFETTLLEAKHLRVRLDQADGVALPEFQAELANIEVKADWLIAELELANAPMTISEARTEMLRWIQFGTMPKRSEAELDSFLAAVAANYIDYNYGPNAIRHDFRIYWSDVKNVTYVVWFQQARHPATPLAVHMKIRFPLTPAQARKSFDIPIPPPPGYENVDMTAPKDFGPDSPPEDPEIERVRRAGVMPDYSGLPEKRIRSGALPRGHMEQAVEAAAARPSRVSSAVWWLVGMATVVIAMGAYASRKGKK